jgi:hypothetical protein
MAAIASITANDTRGATNRDRAVLKWPYFVGRALGLITAISNVARSNRAASDCPQEADTAALLLARLRDSRLQDVDLSQGLLQVFEGCDIFGPLFRLF